MKIALYARISKAIDQTPENQLIELRRWATASDATIIGEFVDEISSSNTRPKKEELLRKLRLGEIDGVAFYALDRWGRTMSELILEFEEAVKRNWTLISLKEGIRLDTAAGQLHAHMFAAFANFERSRIKERTIAGLNRVRAQGKRLGRPIRNFDTTTATQMRAEGKSWRKIAIALKIPAATIRARLTAQKTTNNHTAAETRPENTVQQNPPENPPLPAIATAPEQQPSDSNTPNLPGIPDKNCQGCDATVQECEIQKAQQIEKWKTQPKDEIEEALLKNPGCCPDCNHQAVEKQ